MCIRDSINAEYMGIIKMKGGLILFFALIGSVLSISEIGMALKLAQFAINTVEHGFDNPNFDEVKEADCKDIIDCFKIFCEGFWDGVLIQWNLDHLMFTECGDAPGIILADIVATWKVIINVHINNIKDLYFIYVQISVLVSKIMSNFIPCSYCLNFILQILDIFKTHTLEEIKNRLLFSGISSAYGIITHVAQFGIGLWRMNFKSSGEGLAYVVYAIILHQSNTDSLLSLIHI
eukprot:TRINITY_DN5743_c0_g1_i1.p1 TRINITY_DN5743_c0_g1~~TRINITY_DN5743_c0_g1_i1.p1  ORF type:complete len:243 (+),score=55.94 TRINITY_DN5743_c0_g1_i1:28-729(+)